MKDTLIRRIRELSQSQPDKTALVFKKESLTYSGLYKKILGISGLLKDLIKPGDRVCFTAKSRPEMAAAYLGIQLAGGVAVFLDKNAKSDNIAAVYDTCGAALLLTDRSLKELSDRCRAMSLKQLYSDADSAPMDDASVENFSPNEKDIAELLFTTGTTGVPKGVMLSYGAVFNILCNTLEGTGLQQEDIMLLPLPLNHSFALRVLRACLYRGLTIVLQNGFVMARKVITNLDEFGCSAMACVPASYEMMRSQLGDAMYDIFRRLRLVEFGAGFLTVKQRLELTSAAPDLRILNTWGSSESGGAIFCDVQKAAAQPDTLAALGRPLEGKVEVRFLDTEGNETVATKEAPARMALRGSMIMSGYWGQEELSRESLRDGWLLTGDLAYEYKGWIFMHGRADDIINVGGRKVSPVEVENTAGLYEGIRGCACIGVEDTEGIMGQVPVLFLEKCPGYTQKDLAHFLSERLENYKLPTHYIPVDEIPKNRMQKTDRRALARMWEERNSAELMNPVVEAILNRQSVRRFTDKAIPREYLDMILKAGYNAPNGHNLQSWQFTVLTKEEDINRLRDAARDTAKEAGIKFYGWKNPKAVILVSNDKENYNGCQDSACAAENMMLAAASYSIGSVWLNPLRTLRDSSPVKEVLDSFGVPSGHTVWATVALGYPAREGKKPPRNTDVIIFV